MPSFEFRCSKLLQIALIWSLATPVLADAPDLVGDVSAEAAEFFEKQIRPLLVSKCTGCHGPEEQNGSLRLDTRQAILRGGESGPAIVLDSVDNSPLIQAVRYDGDYQMPPDGKLSDAEIAALEHWVKLGAPWPGHERQGLDEQELSRRNHWAFQPVTLPEVPATPGDVWSRNEIDAFIQAKLANAGLNPAPEADRRTLLRRAAYDLTGLPPTEEETLAFLRDDSPDAYERLIDRLLDSSAYGEHWARRWLDIARYADTKGYVYGREERFFVHSYTYRDWVIQAFNQDLPYDQFLLMQIAADQAVPDQPEHLAAMGFMTVGRRFLGITPDIIDDRIDVLTRGTLGLTVGCARCHDHKYDPIPIRDYYSLYGVFLNSQESLVALDEVPQTEETKAFREELEKRQSELSNTMQSSRKEASERVRERFAEYLFAQTHIEKYPVSFDQIIPKADLVPTLVHVFEHYLTYGVSQDDPVFLAWREYAAIPKASFAEMSSEVTAKLASLPPNQIHPLIQSAFTEPPQTLQEVANRYGQVLKTFDEEWKRLSDAAEDDSSAPSDPVQLALWNVLYGTGSPCSIPDESIVSNGIYFDTGTLDKLWRLYSEVERWLIQSPMSPRHALALQDVAVPRNAFVFKRGDPNKLGDLVPPQFLEVIAGEARKPFSSGSGRLELAQAIIDADNPLTARVWVNRVWMQHFGEGLVRTPSDFGVRADAPSHPELLDWLASTFVKEGWSTKELHRKLMLSSTYRQSSLGPTDQAARQAAVLADPENRLLWRMPVRRLGFEELRDTLLAATGELDRKMGGRPIDLFASNSEASTRRTIYGLVDRQFLPDVMRTFDFASPDLHIPKRAETTSPQQALFEMNHPFMAARARHLAKLVNDGDQASTEDAIRKLFRKSLQREPSREEFEACVQLLNEASRVEQPKPPKEALAWSYGYGELDGTNWGLPKFVPLPHFTGKEWQGGPQWPDASLGWVRIDARGGHAGNDLRHAAIRRWTASVPGTVQVKSTAIHDSAAGDGIRCWIISSRHGIVKSSIVHNGEEALDVAVRNVEPGDTLDFVVDFLADLNSDQFLWAPQLEQVPRESVSVCDAPLSWDAARDFMGPPSAQLQPWEQLAQVLLMSNEFIFVD